MFFLFFLLLFSNIIYPADLNFSYLNKNKIILRNGPNKNYLELLIIQNKKFLIVALKHKIDNSCMIEISRKFLDQKILNDQLNTNIENNLQFIEGWTPCHFLSKKIEVINLKENTYLYYIPNIKSNKKIKKLYFKEDFLEKIYCNKKWCRVRILKDRNTTGWILKTSIYKSTIK